MDAESKTPVQNARTACTRPLQAKCATSSVNAGSRQAVCERARTNRLHCQSIRGLLGAVRSAVCCASCETEQCGYTRCLAFFLRKLLHRGSAPALSDSSQFMCNALQPLGGTEICMSLVKAVWEPRSTQLTLLTSEAGSKAALASEL